MCLPIKLAKKENVAIMLLNVDKGSMIPTSVCLTGGTIHWYKSLTMQFRNMCLEIVRVFCFSIPVLREVDTKEITQTMEKNLISQRYTLQHYSALLFRKKEVA